MGSVSLDTRELHRSAATWAVVAQEENQVQGCGEIVAKKRQIMGRAVTVIMGEPEHAHVTHRTGCLMSEEQVHQTGNNKYAGGQYFERNLW